MEIRPPNKLSLTGNVKENFKRFKQQFELYWEATAHIVRTDKQKVSLFLHVAGTEAIEVYNSFTFAADEVINYETVLSRFENYATPKQNETYERYIFRSRMQKEGESIEQYVVDLKIKAQSCNFGDIVNSLIRDQIVMGVTDKKMRERMLREDELTLEKATKICQAIEQMNIQMSSLEGCSKTSENVNLVMKHKSKNKILQNQNINQSKQFNKKYESKNETANCSRCNTRHAYRQCPAYKKQCRRCKRMNHFDICCKTPLNTMKPRVHTVDHSESEDDFIVSLVDDKIIKGKQWLLNIKIDGTEIVFKIDTGANVNLIPYEVFMKLKDKHKIVHNSPSLKAYNGDNIKTYGTINAKLDYKDKHLSCSIIVVENGRQSIIGLETAEELGIIKRVYEVQLNKVQNKEEILKHYKSLFSGLGKIQQAHTIRLKENNVPVIQASRRIPLSLKEKLKTELDRMVSHGIIEKIDEPTDWVSSLVIVEKKNGSLRICLDPKNLNDNIMREHYIIPTRNEIEAELAGAKYFTKLDANSGFYQIPLEKKSSRLCTFNTPFGRYCFLRVPFGIKSATEIFHKTATQMYDGIKGVKVYIDDVLVYGRTKQEHDERLQQVLDKTLEAGLTFNKDKCEFGKTEILFMGDKLTQNGMTINPENLEAILKMPTPNSKIEVQRILGMINYVGKYIPNLSEKTKHLRNLIRKDSVMSWNYEHKEELENLKKMITQHPVLCYFDPSKETKISSDASQNGIGSVMLQRHEGVWRPVAYASRSLTPCESKYSQIEKETLGLVFGCEKFNDFVYGRQIILETDHKPLITLSKRCLADIPMRLQRLFIRLMKYEFEMIYVSGKNLVIADTLSRSYLKGSKTNEIEELVQIHVDSIIQMLNITNEMLEKFKAETAKDEELNSVIEQIHTGWSNKYAACSFQVWKDDLTFINGLIMKGNRIVVPKTLRNDMLDRIHEGHMGIEKCKRRARQILFWPLMNEDIERKVKRCSTCQKFQYQQPKEQMIHRTSEVPWDCVGTDLYYFAGKHYLIVYDSYSNYPEVEEVRDLSSYSTIKALKKIFARHGIPREVYSDNGTHYDSKEFREFSKKYEFKLTTSSPHYPRSNGLSEKGVQIVKRIFKKAKDSGEDLELGLLNYRNTPLESGSSPAVLLMGRSLRTRLPLYSVKKADFKKHSLHWEGKQLKPLRQGDIVRIREEKEWGAKAKVMREVAPRSYEVCTESNKVLRRNRQHLLKVESQYHPTPEDDIIEQHMRQLQQHERDEGKKSQLERQTPSVSEHTVGPTIAANAKDIMTPVTSNRQQCVHKSSGSPNQHLNDGPLLRRSSRKRQAPMRLDL